MSSAKISEPLLGLYCVDGIDHSSLACAISQQSALDIIEKPPEQLEPGAFLLMVDENRVSLAFTGPRQPKPIAVDFLSGAVNHRRLHGGGKGQMISKAIGLKSAFRPQVLDLTAGLGQDAFVLATLGCHLSLVERNPWIHLLLSDGLRRAAETEDSEMLAIVQRMQLHHGESQDFLQSLTEPVDVIYLDPMFPESDKTAKVKKSMQALQQLLDGDLDAGHLLQAALQKARYRVVVKRPRKAPHIGQQFADVGLPTPSVEIVGKSSRFDVYSLKKLPV